MAKGFNQIKSSDYYETFALVAKIVTVKILIVVVTMKNWDLNQLNVNNAFLHGELQKDIYLKPSLGMFIN